MRKRCLPPGTAPEINDLWDLTYHTGTDLLPAVIRCEALTRHLPDSFRATLTASDQALALLDAMAEVKKRAHADVRVKGHADHGAGSVARWWGDRAKEFGVGVYHVLDGAWDGTVEMIKGVWTLAEVGVDVNPATALARFFSDPAGYIKRQEGRFETAKSLVEAFQHDPIGTARTIGASMLDVDDMRRDPAHWVGGLVPAIVAAIVTDGGGVAAKGAGAVGDISKVAAGSERLSASVLRTHLDALIQNTDVRYWEGVRAINGRMPGHTVEWHLNTTELPNDQYLRALHEHSGKPRDSIFSSEADANVAISKFIDENRSRIESWVLNPDDTTAWGGAVDLGRPIGLAIKGSDPSIRAPESAWVFLRKSTEQPAGFIVQTAYPLFEKY